MLVVVNAKPVVMTFIVPPVRMVTRARPVKVVILRRRISVSTVVAVSTMLAMVNASSVKVTPNLMLLVMLVNVRLVILEMIAINVQKIITIVQPRVNPLSA
jgi:hypothetical protein